MPRRFAFVALSIAAALCAPSALGQKRPPAAAAPDAGTPTAPAPELPTGPDDSALLRGILAAHAPAPQEIRVLAVENLGLLGDPRALDVLGEFLREGSPAVQAAALRAIRAFQHPRAEQLLIELVRDPRAQEPLRVGAVEALAFQRSASAIAFLRSVRADPRYGSKLQNTARVVLDRVAAG